MKTYSQQFYSQRHQKTIYSAQTILSILLERIPEINSAVDIGCGVGTWLSVLQDQGIEEILGLDGDWVNEEFLAIPKECFQKTNLNQLIKPSKRYDLAISLEVAEHLSPDSAENFVNTLAQLSDYVLFSAAVPGQGGINHINEQWQDYWVKLFNNLDYEAYDFIRPKIWDNNRIPFWYKQNILFFSKRQQLANLKASPVTTGSECMLKIIHPDSYLEKLKILKETQAELYKRGVKHDFMLFIESLSNFVVRKFR